MSKTILTGVKPTGSPHLGNYFGAIKPAIEMMNKSDGKTFLFVADVHALNGQKDAAFIREKTYEVAATYLACGLDVNKTVFYRQSDVPEIFELSTLLMNFTPKGLMNRAHAYKAMLDKDGNDDNVNMGLYTYPVLMAADILAMSTDIVPVGPDQKQHVEIARDIANSFNKYYGKDVFVLPEPKIEAAESFIGLDGRKMSKSYGNTIELFGGEDETAKKVMKIPTDSKLPDEPKDTDATLYKLMLEFGANEEFKRQYREGGVGYGDAKKLLAVLVNERLYKVRKTYESYIGDKAAIDGMLAAGAMDARKVAGATLTRVKKTLGLI